MALFSDILLTVDYDRTLTAPDTSIPERNLQAIRFFMDNGGAFTVNTGRSLPMSRRIFDAVPTNAPFILYNGAALWENGSLQHCRSIPLDVWETVRLVRAAAPDMTLEIQAADAHYFFERITPQQEQVMASFGCPVRYAEEGDDLNPFLKFSLCQKMEEASLDYMFHGTSEELRPVDEVEAALNRMFAGSVIVNRAAARIIDVQAAGTGKGIAARQLQQRMGRKYLICAGDADNDISMLEAADFSFCPADGMVADRYPNLCNCANGAIADLIYEKIPQIIGK